VFGSALLASPAGAAPVEPLSGLSSLNDIQQAQFYFGGRRYCWYDSAWRGPGFYWCGYAWRRGYGWGGGYGWRGWHAGRRYGRGYRYGHGYRGGHANNALPNTAATALATIQFRTGILPFHKHDAA
jgi:hypothetical protein